MSFALREKQVGSQKLLFTRLGLGLAALGRPGYINLGHSNDLPADRSKENMRVQAFTVLDAAWQTGIRYFDAARSYGAAEEFLGSWLKARQIDPASVTIGSKWGYIYTANWQVQAEKHEIKDHSLTTLRRQIGESSRYLGPWLKLFQIHSATLESGVLDKSDVLDELARLRDHGLVVGLTLSGPGQSATLEKALQIRRGGIYLFGCVQATWNLLERSAEGMLQESHSAGWLVIVKEALANGRLAERGLSTDSPLRQLSADLNHSIDAVALAAVLHQSWADIVLSGAVTAEQLQANTRAIEIDWKDEYENRLSAMRETSEVYWTKRGELAWN
jgi:aryl-alcohol dehydrogenase-like predicted oxidoreductase